MTNTNLFNLLKIRKTDMEQQKTRRRFLGTLGMVASDTALMAVGAKSQAKDSAAKGLHITINQGTSREGCPD